MKLIRKTYRILGDNSGETMVEVIVAFTLLTFILLTFSNGIVWATRAEITASKSRNSADVAMRALQEYKATSGIDITHYDSSVTVNEVEKTLSGGWRKYIYTVNVDGETYIYYTYDLPE